MNLNSAVERMHMTQTLDSPAELRVNVIAGLLFFMALFCSFSPGRLFATQEDLSGQTIMEEVSRRQFQPFEYEQITITRVNADASRVVRKGRRYSRLQKGDVAINRYLLVFDYPEAIKGVAFLLRQTAGGMQSHWVYLPALGPQMHRVVTGGGGGIFDTDFSIEDLADEDSSQFIYQRKADIMLKKRSHFLVESLPAATKGRWPSHYGLRRIYVDRELYRISRIDYYDSNNILLKRRSNSNGSTAITNIYWRPETILMENLQEGTQTTIQTTIRHPFAEWVPEKLFSRSKIVQGILLEKPEQTLFNSHKKNQQKQTDTPKP